MKIALVLLICCVAVQSVYVQPRIKPNFDCERICGRYPNTGACAIDGKSYRNECFLECDWNYKDCDGKCPCYIKVTRESYCYCEKKYDPVCTFEGETRDNQCVADCEGKKVMYKGECFKY